MQYVLFWGKLLNMIYQRFGRAARASGVCRVVYLLSEDIYSSPLPALQSAAAEGDCHVQKHGPSRLRHEVRSGNEEAEYKSDALSQVTDVNLGEEEHAEQPVLDPSNGLFSLPNSVIILQQQGRVQTNKERTADLPPIIY